MLTQNPTSPIRTIENQEDLAETRLEARGFVFHGTVPESGKAGNRRAKAGSNLLHFARCSKLERVGDGEHKVWFKTIRVAKAHLDEHVGAGRWTWCKVCQREITQRVLNED
jgi:hypothetical protein